MNNPIQNYFNITPNILTLISTHRCTASCDNCCFSCSPSVKQIMDAVSAKRYIDDAIKYFPSIRVLVITGGECFLLGNDLIEIIQYAVNKYRLITRIVTNAYWATSESQTMIKLKPLIDAGLNEINFSTGDEHQKFVKFDNIVHAIKVSCQYGLSVFVSIETQPHGKFTSKTLLDNIELNNLYKEGKFNYIDASWMYFKNSKQSNNYIGANSLLQQHRKPCENILKGIYINPYSQLLSCCGLTVEYNPFLKLGDIDKNTMIDLYQNQFNDLYKLWLLVDGPRYIYEKIMALRNISPKFFPHDCAYCIEIVRDMNNLQILRQILPNEIPNILYRYKILNTGVKIDFQKFGSNTHNEPIK